MKQGHDTVELKRGITAGGVTYTTVKLRVVPYMTEQQIKQLAEVLEQTTSGEWVKTFSREKYSAMMLHASIEKIENNSGKSLNGDLARAAFSEATELHSFDAQRISNQLRILNVIDMAEFGIIDESTLLNFMNNQNMATFDDIDEGINSEKRLQAGTTESSHQTTSSSPAGRIQLESDIGHEQS